MHNYYRTRRFGGKNIIGAVFLDLVILRIFSSFDDPNMRGITSSKKIHALKNSETEGTKFDFDALGIAEMFIGFFLWGGIPPHFFSCGVEIPPQDFGFPPEIFSREIFSQSFFPLFFFLT